MEQLKKTAQTWLGAAQNALTAWTSSSADGSDEKVRDDALEGLIRSVRVERKKGPPLEVLAETPRLRLRPCREDDVPFYQNLWTNPEVMKKYASGKPQTDPEYAYRRLVSNENSWTDRWKQGSPWSGMVVELRETHEPIGAVVVGGGELAYLFDPAFHGQGYGREAVVALVNVIVPILALDPNTPDVPETIEATVRADHIPSRRILETCGFTSDLNINYREFDGQMFERYIFTVSVQQLIQRYEAALADAPGSS
ncbi:Hypothetical Protein FCC1311_042432 [Hondaea fermentalgiana]|uniref:N-acetyltransferase domain-containing protein n=1 Tax=Hondaea fermentalgiana TaxID=2315210 RepID=A0A2R5GAJ3_9STRA|nr:Hypothetical Protein FCC1311_042432 [Hondaea fermentalgiana]|eukprot:GBG28020.1 Hypothetical Protein FCC1311_042432 [Hondaea fermentalgiana]